MFLSFLSFVGGFGLWGLGFWMSGCLRVWMVRDVGVDVDGLSRGTWRWVGLVEPSLRWSLLAILCSLCSGLGCVVSL